MGRPKTAEIDVPKYINHEVDLSKIAPLTDEQRTWIEEQVTKIFGSQDTASYQDIVPGTDIPFSELLKKYAHVVQVNILAVLDPQVLFHIRGNRMPEEKDVGRIKNSINKRGYQPTLGQTNEKGGIIDAQHRKVAIKNIHETQGVLLPMFFFVTPGADKHEILAQNHARKEWTPTNYLLANSESEDKHTAENANKVIELMGQYKVGLQFLKNVLYYKYDITAEEFNTGDYALPENGREYVEGVLKNLSKIMKYVYGEEVTLMKGRKPRYSATSTLYGQTNFDREPFLKRLAISSKTKTELQEEKRLTPQKIYEYLAKIYNVGLPTTSCIEQTYDSAVRKATLRRLQMIGQPAK